MTFLHLMACVPSVVRSHRGGGGEEVGEWGGSD